MAFTKKQWSIGALAVLLGVAIVGGGSWYAKHRVAAFPINPSDTISSWEFKGPYSGNQGLMDQGNADIAHLTSLLGKGQYDDYDLYNGIGNDYDLMGQGKKAYDAFNTAIAIHPDKGLVYTNLAHLMSDLGATYTAADAYAKAVQAEPGMLQYHLMRLQFLTEKFPKDKERLLAAFTEAAAQFGDVAQVLQIEAQWLSGEGRYADAIAAWERTKLLLPGRDTSAIDREIARLRAKQ